MARGAKAGREAEKLVSLSPPIFGIRIVTSLSPVAVVVAASSKLKGAERDT